MKILLVHNDYGKYSGEEAVVDKMDSMFHGLGHDVAQLRMTTAAARENLAGKIRGFVSGVYCPSGVKAMRESLRRDRPDVVNVHNLYPFISPAALVECRKAGVPVVMTVHNFRLMCPTGLFMRDDAPCEDCLERGNEWGCVRHNCEHSILKSIGYAARNAVARRGNYYRECVSHFACITDFQRKKMIQAGFLREKISVIPNCIDVERLSVATPGDYVAYCGRLSREKGIDLILEVARRNPGIPFRLAGSVRDTGLVNDLPDNVKLVGYLSGQSLKDFYEHARFFVMASRWYEGFPMTILEAASCSKTMVAPDHGGFSEIVGDSGAARGLLFPPENIERLDQHVRDLWHNPSLAMRLGENACKNIISKYSTNVIAKEWQSLLERLIADGDHRVPN